MPLSEAMRGGDQCTSRKLMSATEKATKHRQGDGKFAVFPSSHLGIRESQGCPCCQHAARVDWCGRSAPNLLTAHAAEGEAHCFRSPCQEASPCFLASLGACPSLATRRCSSSPLLISCQRGGACSPFSAVGLYSYQNSKVVLDTAAAAPVPKPGKPSCRQRHLSRRSSGISGKPVKQATEAEITGLHTALWQRSLAPRHQAHARQP